MRNKTTVFFIGAGPGDPELITIKARKIIKTADIIIYAGSLVNKDILKFAKDSAVFYDSSHMALPDILDVIKNADAARKTVARLHSGDLSIYSALQEQIDWCERKKITCGVIPGISSFQAAAASLKQELTLPGVSQTIILTRISGRTKVPPGEDLERLSKTKSTMVIFLSIQEIGRVAKKLKGNYTLDTPAVVIEKVSCKEERRIFGTLKDIAEKVREAGIKRQALIIVGDVLKRDYLKSRLYDKNFGHGFRRKK